MNEGYSNRPQAPDVKTPSAPVPLVELEKFEVLVYSRQYEKAVGEALTIFNGLRQGGLFKNHQISEEAMKILCTRFCAALVALIVDPGFVPTEEAYARLCQQSMLIEAAFRISGFRSPDYVMGLVSKDPSEVDPSKLEYASHVAMAKMTLFLNLGSKIDFDFDQLFSKAAKLCLPLWASLMSHVIVLSPRAHDRREMLYRLAHRFRGAHPVPALALSALSDAYMYCSYRTAADKHDVKRDLNELLRASLAAFCTELLPTTEEVRDRRAGWVANGYKPRMLVALEWFNSFHAMHRCYAPMVAQLRQRFHLIGMARKGELDPNARTYFDEVIEVANLNLVFSDLLRTVNEARPDIIYYPSVGMNLHWTALATLRLAPVQVMTLGHPATTMSPEMDYAFTEEGTLGNPWVMNERVVWMPPLSGVHYIKRPDDARPTVPPREAADPIRIAIPAMSLKLNAQFMASMVRIQKATKRRAEFVFMPNTLGMMHVFAKEEINRWLPTALVQPRVGYPKYMEWIAACDLHFSTFPFGGTNSVIDSLTMGKPVLTLRGSQPHERFDAMLLGHLGLAEDLVADSVQQFEEMAHRLIHDDEHREAVVAKVKAADIEGTFYAPRTGVAKDAFVKAMWHVFTQHEAIVASGTHEVPWQDYVA